MDRRWADMFYVKILGIYVHVPASTSDYLPSTGFFFLFPPNRQTIAMLLETHSFWRWTTLNTTVTKRDGELHGQGFALPDDSPQRPQQ